MLHESIIHDMYTSLNQMLACCIERYDFVNNMIRICWKFLKYLYVEHIRIESNEKGIHVYINFVRIIAHAHRYRFFFGC